MKRHAPEERDPDAGPLFAFAQSAPARCEDPVQAAANRAEVGMARAADRATRLDPEWQVAALEAVRVLALSKSHFLAEEVPHSIPEGADPRAFGQVMRAAARMGYVRADGAAPANSSNRSFKVLWKSLLFVPAGEPARS